ncbi:hypothetical protein [Asticcacaulis endophyticus]|uniref:hypothetical protein n=1 Tax=Asticcacaulis endophyticus TaxID=1395890 RepID=UPI001679D481|nr:hypothetical protein [Asticcacaulis endophyticus]
MASAASEATSAATGAAAIAVPATGAASIIAAAQAAAFDNLIHVFKVSPLVKRMLHRRTVPPYAFNSKAFYHVKDT